MFLSKTTFNLCFYEVGVLLFYSSSVPCSTLTLPRRDEARWVRQFAPQPQVVSVLFDQPSYTLLIPYLH